MKLAFDEIWPFLQIVGAEASQWTYKLVVGSFSQEHPTVPFIEELESDIHYDPEMLPNLFTFREIFWQPNVYPTLNACLTGLNLLVNYSAELAEEYADSGKATHGLYLDLVHHIGKLAEKANEQLISSDQASDQIPAVLGEFRKQSFPVIMLFIQHPMNRHDYREDALRRVNFMVKTLIEQYQLRFNDLLLPHWELDKSIQEPGLEEVVVTAQLPEEPSDKETESPD